MAEVLPLALRRHLVVLIFICVPLAMLVLQVWVVARAATLIVPFTCLLAAVGLVTLLQFIARGGKGTPAIIAFVFVLAVAAGENVRFARRLAANHMGYREAAAFLARQPPGTIYADPESMSAYQWYEPQLTSVTIFRFCSDSASPLDPQDLGMAGDYAVFDGQKYHMYPASRRREDAIETELAKRADLIATYRTWSTTWPEMLLDGTGARSLGDMLKMVETVDINDLTTIRVYQLH